MGICAIIPSLLNFFVNVIFFDYMFDYYHHSFHLFEFCRIFRAPLSELISAHNKHLEELNSKVESGVGRMNTSVMDTSSLSKIDLSSNGSKSISEKRSDVEGISLLENIENNPSTSEKWLCQCTTADGMKLDQHNCDMEVTGTSKIDLHPNVSLVVDVKDGLESGLTPKLPKTVKAGRQAPSEGILLWVENCFTRYLLFPVHCRKEGIYSFLCTLVLNIFLFSIMKERILIHVTLCSSA